MDSIKDDITLEQLRPMLASGDANMALEIIVQHNVKGAEHVKELLISGKWKLLHVFPNGKMILGQLEIKKRTDEITDMATIIV